MLDETPFRRGRGRPRKIPETGPPQTGAPPPQIALDSGDLPSLAIPEYLLGGASFERGMPSGLWGPTTIGKSQIGISMVMACANGLDWGGEKFEQGLAVYVGLKKFANVKVRHPAWCAIHGKRADVAVENVLWYDGERIKWSLPSGLESLGKEIDQRIKTRGVPCRLVVIDHTRRALRGAGTLGTKTAAAVIEALEAFAKKYDCAVVLIGHTDSKGEKIAGPKVWGDYINESYRLVDIGGGSIRMEGVKNRDGVNRNVIFKKHVVPLQLVNPKTGKLQDCTGGAVRFVMFEASQSGGDRAGDLLFQIAQKIEFGEVLPCSTLTVKCEWGGGTSQNNRVKMALPQVGVWYRAPGAGEVLKAIRRVSAKEIGLKAGSFGGASEVIQCAAEGDTSAYGPPLTAMPDEVDEVAAACCRGKVTSASYRAHA